MQALGNEKSIRHKQSEPFHQNLNTQNNSAAFMIYLPPSHGSVHDAYSAGVAPPSSTPLVPIVTDFNPVFDPVT